VAPPSVDRSLKHRFPKAGPVSALSDPADLTTAYSQLLGLLIDTPSVDAFLNEVARLAADVVTPAAAAGITIRRNDQPFTVATSNNLAAQVDEIQYGGDEGPCLDALRTGVLVQVDDLTQDERWNRYRPHAIAHGVISSLSLPLAVDGQTIAALNLYSGQRAAFAGTTRQHAETFAAQCAAALTLTLRQAQQAQVQQQLGEAMASRSVIDQAIGILMGQQRCDATTAFDLLRQASQHRNRKLRDIAADIITNVTGGPPQPPTDFTLGPGPYSTDGHER
jgi:GAF domain-containing protein